MSPAAILEPFLDFDLTASFLLSSLHVIFRCPLLRRCRHFFRHLFVTFRFGLLLQQNQTTANRRYMEKDGNAEYTGYKLQQIHAAATLSGCCCDEKQT